MCFVLKLKKKKLKSTNKKIDYIILDSLSKDT